MSAFHTISAKLRNLGCVVKVEHRRFYKHCYNRENVDYYKTTALPINGREALSHTFTTADMLPLGGETAITINFPDNSRFTEVASCSAKDPYNKAKGRDIAIGRLTSRLAKLGVLTLD